MCIFNNFLKHTINASHIAFLIYLSTFAHLSRICMWDPLLTSIPIARLKRLQARPIGCVAALYCSTIFFPPGSTQFPSGSLTIL
jgi:hypothetical protein